MQRSHSRHTTRFDQRPTEVHLTRAQAKALRKWGNRVTDRTSTVRQAWKRVQKKKQRQYDKQLARAEWEDAMAITKPNHPA